MRGFVALDEPDPARGYDRGRADRTALSFRLTIGTDDVDRFVADASHQASATGYVDCDLLGGRRPVEDGRFNLFVADQPVGGTGRQVRRMLYRLPFQDAAGHPLVLLGHKDVDDDPELDLWRDTSTLYTRICPDGPAATAGPDEGHVVAAGVVTIHLTDFLRQLTTFRTATPGGHEPLAALRGLDAFGRLFLGELWTIYAPLATEAARQ